MQLATKHFGLIEINEKDIIYFPAGLPGFEHVKKFVLLGNVEEEYAPFKWLQGVDKTDLAFVVMDPRLFKPDYLVKIEAFELNELEIQDENQVLIYTIIVVPEDIKQMTANLKAPIIINPANNMGKQVIQEINEYSVRHNILNELQHAGV